MAGLYAEKGFFLYCICPAIPLFFYNMSRIHAYILLTRPANLLIAFISIFAGGFVTGSVQPLFLLLMACVSGTLIMAGANAINDFYDLDIDKVNRPSRPLPAGLILPGAARLFGVICMGLGVVLALRIHLTATIIALSASLLVYIYSWRLKGTAVWGNLVVSLVTAFAFVYGGLAVGRMGNALIVGAFAFLYHWGREIIKDIEDMAGDRKQGLGTLPLKYGMRTAMTWATAILGLLVVVTILPFLSGYFNHWYLAIVVVGVDFFLIYVIFSMWMRPEPAHLGKLALWMKADMLMGLLAVYAGSR